MSGFACMHAMFIVRDTPVCIAGSAVACMPGSACMHAWRCSFMHDSAYMHGPPHHTPAVRVPTNTSCRTRATVSTALVVIWRDDRDMTVDEGRLRFPVARGSEHPAAAWILVAEDVVSSAVCSLCLPDSGDIICDFV